MTVEVEIGGAEDADTVWQAPLPKFAVIVQRTVYMEDFPPPSFGVSTKTTTIASRSSSRFAFVSLTFEFPTLDSPPFATRNGQRTSRRHLPSVARLRNVSNQDALYAKPSSS